MATPPRIILPGRTVHLIINASNQQFRFAPKPEVIASIQYIFWYCVAKYKVSVHDHCWMSNHAHCVLTDEEGNLPNFMNCMNALISRQLNAIRKSNGGNIEKGYSDIELLDDECIIETCAYALANPCSVHLATTARTWRGITSARLEYGQEFEVTRPKCGLWAEARAKTPKSSGTPQKRSLSKLPEKVQGSLTRPKIHPELSDQELRAKVFEETQALEKTAAKERRLKNKKIVPWVKVQARRPNDTPKKLRSGSNDKPRFSTNCPKLRELAWMKIDAFRDQYAQALDHFVNKAYDKAVFPAGTWKMRVRFDVNCHPPESLSNTI